MKIALCDDNLKMLSELENQIIQSGPDGLTIDCYSSGDALLKYLSTAGTSYQIYLLDIEMPGRSGIETAAAIRSGDAQAVIIFITDYKEYVYEVFEVLPFRFISKPVDPTKLIQAVTDAIAHLKAQGQLFFFHIGHEEYQVPYADILYFESAARKITLYTQTESYEFYGKLKSLSAELDPELFARTHASYIVNLDAVRSIRKGAVRISTGQTLPVSRNQQTQLHELHIAYMQRRCRS